MLEEITGDFHEITEEKNCDSDFWGGYNQCIAEIKVNIEKIKIC